MRVIKRDGRIVQYSEEKVANAVRKAFEAVNIQDDEMCNHIAHLVTQELKSNNSDEYHIEYIQDMVEKELIHNDLADVAVEYIRYRQDRTRVREMNSTIMHQMEELTFSTSTDMESKRENANINGDTSMGTMLKYGTEVAKAFNFAYLVSPDIARAHKQGDIHIHDADFMALTETCCQIDLEKLFKGGFNTGHGYVREPGEIRSYSALACIAIQSNQNEMHGGQSIPAFDYYMAPGVAKTFVKKIRDILDVKFEIDEEILNRLYKELKKLREEKRLLLDEDSIKEVKSIINEYGIVSTRGIDYTISKAIEYTEKDVYQAMEAMLHNLNTMHSRAGSQVPFSSINYGTDTSPEGRMVMKNLLLSTEKGLGNGETCIFPVQIFKVKEGINFNPGDPNYDLFRLACKVSAKRLYPNFSNLDVGYNSQYYKNNDINTEIAYMGCRTRVIGNVYDPTREQVTGRGNLSFTSINLPRLALKATGGVISDGNEEEISKFFELLTNMMELVHKQLLERFDIQCRKHPRNYPFLMGQGIWLDSEKLEPDDDITAVLKQGTLSVGFIGLAETLKVLTGFHHGESQESQELGLKIIGYMRELTDKWSEEEQMNYGVLATPAEGLSGRFLRIDRKLYGEIPGVTDREYYTNSSHVPVYFPISITQKISIEAPYHKLENAGHIAYIEVDGDISKNIPAFEKIIRFMHDKGVGYGAINHPVDYDPVCGYVGIIGDKCPKCGRRNGEGIPMEKLNKIKNCCE